MSCERIGSTQRNTYAEPASATTACEEGSGESAILPDPVSELEQSTDVGAKIASLLVTMAREQKKAAREARAAAEAAQREAEAAELDAMKDKAAWKLGAGLVEGASKVASGAIGMDGALTKCDVKAKSLEAAAKLVDGAGRMDSAMLTFVADGKDVDAKRAEQYGARQKRAAEEQGDMERDAKELADRALGYYKEYLTAKADTQRATLLRA